MKLLILTQAVDKNNRGLGFFHRWLLEFSKYFEKITVLCLYRGEYTLPDTIEVCSLGKEEGENHFKYVWRFYTYIWQKRNQYDAVFVHMNQEYVLLGGLFWRLWGKKIVLWRNHPKGSVFTDLAVAIANNVFATSKFAYTRRFKKTRLMSAGIDTEQFEPLLKIEKKKNSIVMFGRISPVKKVEDFIKSLALLSEKKVPFLADIVGDPGPLDYEYYQKIKQLVKENNLEQQVTFKQGVTNIESVALYNQYQILVNLTPTGSLDKTIFEAMACGTITVVSVKDMEGLLPEYLVAKEGDIADIASKIERVLALPEEDTIAIKVYLRNFVIKQHSLKAVASYLFQVCNE
jgi:glycosyltransferase involved in cell wall biosynthesis